MKTALLILLVCLVAAIALAGCRLLRKRNTAATIAMTATLPGKAVIVYYSQSKVGNTATVAQWIQKHVGCEMVAIEPVEPYPDAYSETLKAANAERREKARRAIKPVAIPEDCDVVFIGSPIWYGTYAPALAAFLEENPLAGKTVVPFSTHGGGGAPLFESDLKAACPEATVLPGFTARGSNQIERRLGVGVTSHHTENDVITWLNTLFPADGPQPQGEQK